MDFTKTPNLKTKEKYELKNHKDPIIAIITPYYNAGKTILDTANTVFNQTYPFFEWIIVDDGSKNKDSLDKLEEIENQDSRVKVYHQKNRGPAAARDYGIEQSSSSVKYVIFLDSDDMMDNTMLECMYWTLESHPRASFTYTSMINFGAREFYWEPYITLDKQKVDNLINISCMVKKEDLIEVGGFELREKGIYEDWNLWLKLLAKGKIPIRLNAPVFWYRTNDTGEFSRAKQNHKRAMEIINKTAKSIKKNVEIIQYPRMGDSAPTDNSLKNMTLPMYKKLNKKKTVLFIFPWAVVGGADVFNLELLKRINKDKYNCIVLTTVPMKNELRQEMEDYVNEFYDLSTFLDYRDYSLFVEYLVKSRNIDVAFVSNTVLGYSLLAVAKKVNPKLLAIDYVHAIDLRDSRGGFGKYSKELDDIIDVTLTCNNYTKKQLQKDYNKKNVETVYIGTDEERFDINKYDINKLKQKYNIPTDKKIIGFVARLSYEKRPEIFIKIANKLLKQRDDIAFVIAGDGPVMNDIKKQIKDYGIQDKVILLGTIRESENVYACCDVTVNCSLLEGLALTSYESLAMGVPVVSADVGGQAELIDNSVGKIIKNNFTNEDEEISMYVNAINDIFKELNNIKKNCRLKILNGFTLNQMTNKIENIFEREGKSEKTISFVDALYSYYAEKVHDYLEGSIHLYYENNLDVVLSRVDDSSKFVKIKTYFRGIAHKYYLEKEMYNIFKVIRYLYRGIKNLISSFINIAKFIIMIIPMLFNILHCVVRIIRLKMKK